MTENYRGTYMYTETAQKACQKAAIAKCLKLRRKSSPSVSLVGLAGPMSVHTVPMSNARQRMLWFIDLCFEPS